MNLFFAAPTTLEEAEAFLQRNGAAEHDAMIPATLNAAAAWMERFTARRLTSRTYRDPVVIAGCTLTVDSKAITGAGFTAGIKAHDPVVGVGIAPGTRVESVESNTALTLSSAATATVEATASLTFGSEPLLLDGTGKRTIYLPERPVSEVYAARSIGSDGSESALDVTGARIDSELGLLQLVSGDIFPSGDSNIEIDCRAGYRAPSATDRGHHDWGSLQWICHRLAQCFFQDYVNAAGRVTNKQLASANFQFADFDVPDDVLRIRGDGSRSGAIVGFVRRW